MNERLVALLAALFTVLLIVLVFASKPKQHQPQDQPPPIVSPDVQPNNPEPTEPPKPEEPSTPEPKFEKHPAQRNITNLGKVLSDIESHMPAGHIYQDSDKITWGHETTHGINSNLRMEFSRRTTAYDNNPNRMIRGQIENTELLGEMIEDIHGHPVFKSYARINGFYVLEDRAVIIDEPNTTITAAANLVPKSLRGGVYNLYMVQQASSWNDTPLYVFDEWTAYGNGAAVRLDLGIKERAETVTFMLEFNVYAICVGQASKTTDEQFKNYLKWNIARSMKLYADSKEKLGNAESHDSYLETMRTATDAESFRAFARSYLGADWTKHIMGF